MLTDHSFRLNLLTCPDSCSFALVGLFAYFALYLDCLEAATDEFCELRITFESTLYLVSFNSWLFKVPSFAFLSPGLPIPEKTWANDPEFFGLPKLLFKPSGMPRVSSSTSIVISSSSALIFLKIPYLFLVTLRPMSFDSTLISFFVSSLLSMKSFLILARSRFIFSNCTWALSRSLMCCRVRSSSLPYIA